MTGLFVAVTVDDIVIEAMLVVPSLGVRLSKKHRSGASSSKVARCRFPTTDDGKAHPTLDHVVYLLASLWIWTRFVAWR